jgi:hypothetical protein
MKWLHIGKSAKRGKKTYQATLDTIRFDHNVALLNLLQKQKFLVKQGPVIDKKGNIIMKIPQLVNFSRFMSGDIQVNNNFRVEITHTEVSDYFPLTRRDH